MSATTTATVWTPCTVCWTKLKLATPATHKSRYLSGSYWCDEHALPGDPPLGEASTAVAVGQVRRRVWPELDEPQGLKNDV